MVTRGLADKIHTYNGCYVPRFIAKDPARGLSFHTFGTAIALNAATNYRGIPGDIDRTVVAIFKRWASPGAATGTTPTRCTSSWPSWSPLGEWAGRFHLLTWEPPLVSPPRSTTAACRDRIRRPQAPPTRTSATKAARHTTSNKGSVP